MRAKKNDGSVRKTYLCRSGKDGDVKERIGRVGSMDFVEAQNIVRDKRATSPLTKNCAKSETSSGTTSPATPTHPIRALNVLNA
jgi:hypothetical protein